MVVRRRHKLSNVLKPKHSSGKLSVALLWMVLLLFIGTLSYIPWLDIGMVVYFETLATVPRWNENSNSFFNLATNTGRFLRTTANEDHASSSNNNDTKLLGTVVVDFYRTVVEKQCLFVTWNEYSIPKWRIWLQLLLMNAWYDGRVDFQQGNLYSLPDPSFHESDNCFDNLNDFADLLKDKEDIIVKDPYRVSVVFAKRMDIPGCASGINVPLGGDREGQAPALAVAMSVPFFPFHRLGFSAFPGGSLAHEMGHILGLQHTSGLDEFGEGEGVVQYLVRSSCSATGAFRIVEYPRWDRSVKGLLDNIVWSPNLNITYRYKDWYGRSNIMAPFDYKTHPREVLNIGLFSFGYQPIFEQIVQCWFANNPPSPLSSE